ncbi:uncharacterized protein E0L32_004518 [Thyridium curvatum]|uniref:Uncharacterized protein n=1 Tax=Thyridium curvatum TaxID=1093900 RepID=A0A507BE63_9PEZI|nr:uncharacterized protein E0L32_004518 [Thyridium curvatum]TPX15241.1 hypothetical protein E0L32_004518 [Thyridium curvatum]
MKTSAAIAALTSFGAVVLAADCPAAGTTNAAGDYSCNPAHQYPAGQTCVEVNGCYVLRSSAASSSNSAAPAPSQACAAPGSTNAKGDYSCNPAHQYPAGQTCELVDGCYVLRSAAPSSTSSGGPAPSQTCAAPGSTNAKGDYSCNPAHQYPAGQTCELVDGCYVIRAPASSTAAPPPQTTTASCAAPGTTGSAGEYSCNPAHQYPAGQTCVQVNGCYVLRGGGGAATTTGPSPPVTAGAAQVSGALSAVAGLVAAAVYGLM